ncbi:MAG TPA: hypothetical protein VN397_03460 [Candidatus Methylomirabilis sp.]|nr:hypothetical protein [Candidatus Methylomirabilis sp.]
MIASVIPAIRTPRGVDVFDYDIPDNMSVRVGDIIWIPFRTKRIVGLVHAMNPVATTDRPRKPIEATYAGLRLNDRTLRLLDALAIRSLTSKPSILHAWLAALPKKPSVAASRLVQPSLMAIREERYLPNHWLGPHGIVATAKSALKDKKRVLVLTPWAVRAAWLAHQCGATLLTGDLSTGARFRAWSGFIRDAAGILVTTRIGAWLAAESDLVILDEPENDDHKQDELAPRFDGRWIAEETCSRGVSLISIGLTPRLTSVMSTAPSATTATTLTTPPTLEPRFIAIDTHRSDWSPISGLQRRTVTVLEEALKTGKEVFVIHPIHGDRARVRCADCGWTATCARCGAGLTIQGGRMVCMRCHGSTETTLTCPACGGQDLSRSRPGRERLMKDLHAHGFDGKVHIVSIGEWNERTDIASNAFVILTDLSLLSGGAEDVRRRERLIVSFRRLADACQSADATLVVQSDPILLADAKSWLTGSGCLNALRHEAVERAQFHLPPATRHVKIIVRDSEQAATDLLRTMKAPVAAIRGATLSGPFPVLFRPSSTSGRLVVHLTVPSDTTDSAIVEVLQPILSTNALIDLDPVAYFE